MTEGIPDLPEKWLEQPAAELCQFCTGAVLPAHGRRRLQHREKQAKHHQNRESRCDDHKVAPEPLNVFEQSKVRAESLPQAPESGGQRRDGWFAAQAEGIAAPVAYCPAATTEARRREPLVWPDAFGTNRCAIRLLAPPESRH
jgi:hypothetical protein